MQWLQGVFGIHVKKGTLFTNIHKNNSYKRPFANVIKAIAMKFCFICAKKKTNVIKHTSSLTINDRGDLTLSCKSIE